MDQFLKNYISLYFLSAAALCSVSGPAMGTETAIKTQFVTADKISSALKKNRNNNSTQLADNETSSTLATGNSPAASTVTKNLAGQFTLGESLGLYDNQEGKREKSLDLEAGLSYQFQNQLKLSAAVSGSLDQNDYENNDMAKAALRLSKGSYEIFSSLNHQKALSLTPSLGLSLPISKTQRNQSFQAGLSTAITLGLHEGLLPSDRLGLSFSLSATRNFFTYETTSDGRSNAITSSAQAMNLGYDLTQKLGLSLSLNHYNSWTAQGTAGESYSHSQELGYKFNSSLTAALGHQLGNPAANIYKADGQTMNLNLVNEIDSVAYVNMTYSY